MLWVRSLQATAKFRQIFVSRHGPWGWRTGAIITAARRGVALQAHTCNRGQIYRRWHTHNYRFPKSQVVKSWNFIWLLNCPPFKPDSWKQRDDSLNDFIYDYLERLLVFVNCWQKTGLRLLTIHNWVEIYTTPTVNMLINNFVAKNWRYVSANVH